VVTVESNSPEEFAAVNMPGALHTQMTTLSRMKRFCQLSMRRLSIKCTVGYYVSKSLLLIQNCSTLQCTIIKRLVQGIFYASVILLQYFFSTYYDDYLFLDAISCNTIVCGQVSNGFRIGFISFLEHCSFIDQS
jgi:hypothetical protein